MAYPDDIDSLSPDHRWSFDNTLADAVGTADLTSPSTSYSNKNLCRDTTNAASHGARTNVYTIPDTTDINGSNQERKTVAGWIRTEGIEGPPVLIYGEGDNTVSFKIMMGWGNNVLFEVDDGTNIIQIFSDHVLNPNGRDYHLALVYEGTNYGNTVRAYIDGIEQSKSEPDPPEPNATYLPSRGQGFFGNPTSTMSVGGSDLDLQAFVNTNTWIAQWATWNVALTENQIRQTLFGKGALASDGPNQDTAANMKADLEQNFSNFYYGDSPIAIGIYEPTDSSNLSIVMEDTVFDPRVSIHYTWLGSGLLEVVNVGQSNGSIGNAENGGTVKFYDRVNIDIDVVDIDDGSDVINAYVYITAASGGQESVGTVIYEGQTTAGTDTTTFDLDQDYTGQPVDILIRKGTKYTGNEVLYKEYTSTGTITKNGLKIYAQMIKDI